MTEPTTAAGRATVEAFYQYTAVEDRDLVRDYILAIEAEARAAVYREIGELSELHAEAVAAIRAAALDEARAAVEREGLRADGDHITAMSGEVREPRTPADYVEAYRARALAAIDALREKP